MVDEFNDPFHPDTLVLNVYKSRLNHHIGIKHALIKYDSCALNASFAIEYTKKIMPKLIHYYYCWNKDKSSYSTWLNNFIFSYRIRNWFQFENSIIFWSSSQHWKSWAGNDRANDSIVTSRTSAIFTKYIAPKRVIRSVSQSAVCLLLWYTYKSTHHHF